MRILHAGAMLLSRLAAAVLLALALSSAPASAQEPLAADEVKAALAEWNRLLDRSTREVNALRLDETRLQRLAEIATEIKDGAAAMRERAEVLVEEAKELLLSLGVAQGESEEAQARRKEIDTNRATYDGWVKQIDLAVARAEQLLDKISAKRLQMLARTLTERHASPLNPTTWVRAFGHIGELSSVLFVSVRTWTMRVAETDPVARRAALTFLGALVVLVGLSIPVRLLILNRFGRSAHRWPAEPSPAEIVASGAVEAAACFVPLAAAYAAVYFFTPEPDLLPNGVVMAVVYGAVWGVVFFLVCRGAVRIALEPGRPRWRSHAFTDFQAVTLSRRLVVLAAILGLDRIVDKITEQIVTIEEFGSIWILAVSLTLIWSLLRAMDRELWPTIAAPQPADRQTTDAAPWAVAESLVVATASGLWSGLRIAAIAIVGIAPLTALAGYTPLAQFLYTNVVLTGVILAFGVALRSAGRDVLPVAFDIAHPVGAAIGNALTIGAQGLRLIQFWLTLALDFAVFAGGAVLIMLVWGAGTDDILLMVARLLDGVRIGTFTFSLTDLFFAIVVFMVALSITRFVQRVLEVRIFPGTQLDQGVRHSLKSGVGYIGLVVASGLAISTLGLNLSNLALLAGALTVGIGFGLQTIVNNFVSGLILLVERPIKAGDWIVVGDKQGVVKRINVRATELETQQRASVLIPNSDFLSMGVINWTHKDRYGRVDIPVTVTTIPDAAKARDLLIACAKRHPRVVKNPGPGVMFKDFAGDTFQFELQVFVENVTQMSEVASDLRFAIDAALREAARPAPT